MCTLLSWRGSKSEWPCPRGSQEAGFTQPKAQFFADHDIICNVHIVVQHNSEAVKITSISFSALFQPGRREEGRGKRAVQDEELQGRAAAILGGHQ